jgi:hypothetical protein
MTRVAGLLCSTVLVLAGCSDDSPVCARATDATVTPSSPLALSANATLVKSGDGFVLAAVSGKTIRWARMDNQGVLSAESTLTLPTSPATLPDETTLGPVVTVAGKTDAADQLTAVIGVARTDNSYDLVAFTQTANSTADPVQTVLTESPIFAGAASGSPRVVASASVNGMQGLVAWAVEGQAAPIKYAVLGADAKVVHRDQVFADTRQPLSCVRVVQGTKAFALSALKATSASAQEWQIMDIGEDGFPVDGGSFSLAEVADDCRVVSTSTAETHFVAWQNRDKGTFFAAYFPSTTKVVLRLATSVTEFGAYIMMPKVAWIAPAGNDVTIGLDRSSGAEVVRYDLFGNPKGRALQLPRANAETGPISAWVAPDGTVYVTYLDQTRVNAGASGTKRHLVAVQAPATLR